MRITDSSGNVFADLHVPNAESEAAKMDLAVALNDNIAASHLSLATAAKTLGVSEAEVSAIGSYNLSGLSPERLSALLGRLKNEETTDG
jgi:predicted XRE-type DNA-binding protein